MKTPPLGYDDESIITKKRLKLTMEQFQDELTKVEKMFLKETTRTFQFSDNLEKYIKKLRLNADELGSEYTFIIETLISDYENFRQHPNASKLEKLTADVRELTSLLS